MSNAKCARYPAAAARLTRRTRHRGRIAQTTSSNARPVAPPRAARVAPASASRCGLRDRRRRRHIAQDDRRYALCQAALPTPGHHKSVSSQISDRLGVVAVTGCTSGLGEGLASTQANQKHSRGHISDRLLLNSTRRS